MAALTIFNFTEQLCTINKEYEVVNEGKETRRAVRRACKRRTFRRPDNLPPMGRIHTRKLQPHTMTEDAQSRLLRVGKTSARRSIARCGKDACEDQGKFIHSLKHVESQKPVVLIDEIDKTGRQRDGDPASVFLEMSYPEQNEGFLDPSVDLPMDPSNVLFACTVNALGAMEALEVGGSVSEEKSQIAEKYLGPQASDACGLKDADVDVTLEAVDQWYTKPPWSSGTPDFALTAAAPPSANPSNFDIEPEKAGETHHAATVEREPKSVPSSIHVLIMLENLKECIGPAVRKRRQFPFLLSFRLVSDTLIAEQEPSWLSKRCVPWKGSLQLASKLGKTSHESAQIPSSWFKSYAYEIGLTISPNEVFFADLYIHVPEGAVSNEGPSAGTASLVAFVRLFKNIRVDSVVVLLICGLEENIETITAPEALRSDAEEYVPVLEENIRVGSRRDANFKNMDGGHAEFQAQSGTSDVAMSGFNRLSLYEHPKMIRGLEKTST
ncbi:hypothetical protein BKA70DRAFT_1409085 [Coprinopsis sp. MPI-PUGE-AT-0042]|nr:hypothetical protein BKA70DRAFT_1409085 [Coprinopsis sp. MPI-PUGE-AT-0042]